MTADHYAILGVPDTAGARDLERAFRRLSRQFHPDVSGDPMAGARQREINAAWAVLRDPRARARYDRSRRERARSTIAWGVRARTVEPGPGSVAARETRPEARVRSRPGAIDFGFLRRGEIGERTVTLTSFDESLRQARLIAHGDWIRLADVEVEGLSAEARIVADPRDLVAFWDGPGAESARVDGWIEVVDRHGSLRIPAGAILRRDLEAAAWLNPYARRVS